MGGCASSKMILEGDERISAGLKPLQRKIEDAKKRRRQSRYSIVSTTELLSQEAVNSSDSLSGKANPSAIVPEPIPEEVEFKNGAMLQNLRDDLPGSPSFRFYCTDNLPNRSFDSNESFKLPASFQRSENVKEADEKIQDGKPLASCDDKIQDSKPIAKSVEQIQESKPIVKSDEKIQDVKPIAKSVEKIQDSKPIVKSDEKNRDGKPAAKPQVSNEGSSEGKSTKKGRKLLTLPKAPGAVQNLFTCYTSTHSAASNQQKK